MRERGIGVIHGGENSLRFTPHFAVTAEELELVIGMVKRALLEGPREHQANRLADDSALVLGIVRHGQRTSYPGELLVAELDLGLRQATVIEADRYTLNRTRRQRNEQQKERAVSHA